ncbi:MAG: hypothetical protein GF421_07895 [Candidatus Aminicenantes bacterium]|nr:hypothetical protein [Candidatus Aminicenantes bacterium]
MSKYKLIIVFIFFFALASSIFVNIHSLQKHFLFSDESTYYMMTQSIAHDGDLQYTKKDLIRYCKKFPSGPLGLFLKKGKQGKIYFAKSAGYSIFAAPFVRLLGANGFLVFHSLLLLLLLSMGHSYYSLSNPENLSLAFIFTFVFASVAVVYFLWMTPDFFNLFLAFSVLFLWLYKHHRKDSPAVPSAQSKWEPFLLSDYSDYAACALIGIAVFSKPPNIALLGPVVLYSLLKKRFVKAGAMVLIFLAVSGLFWGGNALITGDWNYQGGERKSFYGEGGFPLAKENLTFDSTPGYEMTTKDYSKKHFYPPKVFITNIFYYFFGRYAGITWYFFPAFLALMMFFIQRKHVFNWLVLAALLGEILIWIILMPDNYAGGGGALANRYFLNIYPFFFFLPGYKRQFKEIGVSWIFASVFIGQILISPLQHSHFPATHVKKLPFKILPIEMTLINNFPTNTNPYAHRQPVGIKDTFLYFLDDNFLPRKSPVEKTKGFYTRGSKKSEMVLKTFYPIQEISFHLRNNPRYSNRITVWFAGESKSITLTKLQTGILTFTPKKVFKMNKWIHLYKLSIKAQKGSIPYLEREDAKERRYLGVYFEVETTKGEVPE